MKRGESVEVGKLWDKVSGWVGDVVGKCKVEERVGIDVVRDMVKWIRGKIEGDGSYEGVCLGDVWSGDEVGGGLGGVGWVDLVRGIEKEIGWIGVIRRGNGDVVGEWGSWGDNGEV